MKEINIKKEFERIDNEFSRRLDEIKESGSSWEVYEKFGEHLIGVATYWYDLRPNVAYCKKYFELKKRLDSYVIDNLPEDDACQYFICLSLFSPKF